MMPRGRRRYEEGFPDPTNKDSVNPTLSKLRMQ
jgi:hypothetical protein